MNPFILREAMVSTALSHGDACKCDTCKAVAGDKAAMRRVMVALFMPEVADHG